MAQLVWQMAKGENKFTGRMAAAQYLLSAPFADLQKLAEVNFQYPMKLEDIAHLNIDGIPLSRDPDFSCGFIKKVKGHFHYVSSQKGRQQSLIPSVLKLVEHPSTIKLCTLIAEDSDILRTLKWWQVEDAVAAALRGIGFHVPRRRSSKDGGKDVVVKCRVNGRYRTYYVAVKHWSQPKRPGKREVAEFVEINRRDQTDGGLFLSTSGFTECIHGQLAKTAPNHVRLGGYEKIVSLCRHFCRSRAGRWIRQSMLPQVLLELTVPCDGTPRKP